jgi:uncharacterized membrane protein (DUF485 family)
MPWCEAGRIALFVFPSAGPPARIELDPTYDMAARDIQLFRGTIAGGVIRVTPPFPLAALGVRLLASRPLMSAPQNSDLTPQSGGETDVAPLGRSGPKPEHERTADEDRDLADWDAIAAHADFKKLLADRAAFILPATIFFLIYYFALPVLVGWWPDLMKTKIGGANLAYLFALSQFFMAWIVAGFYVVRAAGWDREAADLLSKFRRK